MSGDAARCAAAVALAAALVGACFGAASAETPRWDPVPGPYGVDGIVAVAADPSQPDRVYAATRRDAYVSLDGGLHFAKLPGFLQTPVYGTSARSLAVLRSAAEPAIYPPVPPQLLVGTESGGVFYSADGGRTFVQGQFIDESAASVATIWALYPVLASRNIAFLYAGQSLYRTADGGATWRRVETPPNVGSDWSLALAVLDDAGNALLLCRADGIFRSGDGGTTWTAVTTGLPLPPYTFGASAARDAAHPGVVYIEFANLGTWRSSDNGMSWVRTGTATDLPWGQSPLLARAGVLLWGDQDLWRSTDDGRTWTLTFAKASGYPTSAALGSPPSRVYAGGGPGDPSGESGVWVSDDDGATWRAPGVGIAATRVDFALVDAAGAVYAKRYNDLYARADGEQAWRDATPTPYIPFVALVPPEDVVVLGADSLLVRGSDRALYRSDDGGVNWQVVGASAYALIAAEPGQPNVLYGRDYAYRCDHGFCWIAQTNILKSVDGGLNWQSIDAGLPLLTYRLFALGNARLLAVTSDGYWSSPNAGMQWTRTAWQTPAGIATSVNVRSVAPDPVDRGLLHAVTDQGLFRSDDAGASFALAGPLPASDAKFVAVAADAARTVYVATYPALQVYASADGGATWTAIGLPLQDGTEPTGIVASPTATTTLYATTDHGVLKLNARTDVARAVEFYHRDFDHYFVTADRAEAEMLSAAGLPPWVPTGETWPVVDSGTPPAVPVCRFFSAAFAPKSSHFYTPFADECAKVRTYPEWQFESYAFDLEIPPGFGSGTGTCRPGTLPLYRLYNNGMGGAPNHRYTTSSATFAAMIGAGWVFEGEATTKVFACVPQ
jgi:photosystem II stability/assembly factor-like uncharacterized protein